MSTGVRARPHRARLGRCSQSLGSAVVGGGRSPAGRNDEGCDLGKGVLGGERVRLV